MRTLRSYAGWALTLGLLAGNPLAAQSARAAFENDQVMINERHGQPHDHKLNRVMIYLQDGGEILHYLDGKDVTLKWRAGDVRWSPASGMHTSEIPDSMKVLAANSPILVDIGIKKEGDPAKVASGPFDPLRADPRHCKLEFENSQVRVIRVRVPPHESLPMHGSLLNHVIVYLTDLNARVTSPDGTSRVIARKMGDFSWNGPSQFAVENLDDKPFEAVAVELKN